MLYEVPDRVRLTMLVATVAKAIEELGDGWLASAKIRLEQALDFEKECQLVIEQLHKNDG